MPSRGVAIMLFLAAASAALPARAESLRTWDYDRAYSAPLESWRFLAVSDAHAAPPSLERTRLAVVDLPWQLERPRAMGFWMTEAAVPERFAGRDVFLRFQATGPVRVYLDGDLRFEQSGMGQRELSVLIASAETGGGTFDLAIAVQHGDTPARLEWAKLIAEPAGLTAALDRRGAIFAAFPSLNVDARPAGWAVMPKGPDAAAAPAFDDSSWERVAPDWQWPEMYSHCWFRGRLKVPEKIGEFPTTGRPMHLVIRFDDAGRVFLDGKELKQVTGSPTGTSFELPAHYTPGAEVFAAIRVVNDWGPGEIEWMEWRFADLNAAAMQFRDFATETTALERVLRMHDEPDARWLVAFNAALDRLAEGVADVASLAAKTQQASKALAELWAMMDERPTMLLTPYLQDLRTDQAKIMWETSAPVESYVEFGEAALERRADEITAGGRIHEAVLPDLKPDTAYAYRVVSGKYASETFQFRTAPAGQKAFAFLVWGDNRSDPPMCEKVAMRMAEAEADMVFNTGDVVGSGSAWDEWTRHYLVPIRHWSHRWPSYVSIGNHEYGGGGWETKHIAGFEQYLAHPTVKPGSTEYWYSFDYSNAHFIFIDGNRFEEDHAGSSDESLWHVKADDPQLLWIEQDLKKAQGQHKWVFAFLHAPPYSEGWSGGYYDGEPAIRNSLVPLLERYEVDILFSGHTHDYERGLPHPPYDDATGRGNNTAYIISGGGGASLDNHKYYEWEQIDLPDHEAVPDSDEPDAGAYYRYHYCQVRVGADAVSLEAHEVRPDGSYGGVFDRFKLVK